MTSGAELTGQDELIDALAGIRQARARATFLRRNRQLWHPSVVERIYARVVRLARTDLVRADGLARAAHWIAERLGDEACRAQSLRAIGHVHHTRGEYAEALEHHQAAQKAYRDLGRDIDVARSLNGALQSLICLGRYDEALAWAAEARAIYERHHNDLGLARLDSNVGNILYRQDRFAEALVLYERAHEQLTRVGEPQDVAATLINMAVVQISLNGFDNAVRAYHEARAFCQQHDMPLFTLRADYNIASLYYMRGEYTRALDMYRTARAQSDRLGDPFHAALCDLDRSEIYLELNLADEAKELAAQALERFDELGMNYEAAKAVTILALTTSRGANRRGSHALFNRARRLFAREHNQVWLGLLDFYEAVALFRDRRYAGATLLCHQARRQLEHHLLPGKAALCDLLLSRLALQSGDVELAEQACRDAFDKLAGAEAPMPTYQAHCVLGLLREAQGDPARAFDAFQQAAGSLEHLRNHLQSESLRVAFLEDKLDVYERLVTTCLTSGPADEAAETAFGYIEKAKSRSLADLIALRAINVAPRGDGEASDQVRRLRQELIWYSQQVEQEELKPEGPSARRIDSLRGRAAAIEQQLVKALTGIERADEEFSVLQNGTTFSVDEIRASLAPGAIILEYYQAMGRLYVCVLGHNRLEIVALGAVDEVRSRLQLLQFQLARFRRDPDDDAVFAEPLRAATEAHLRALHALLIAPIRDRLQASHLVVIPHDVLHTVPFHALFDGERFLIDDFTISYAPSASVHRLCWAKPAREGGSLVMGVPDARTPFIADEVHAVAGILPDSQVFLGESATSGQLQQLGARSRFVHIATHGVFRKDNAMFSSIRLGDGPLSVYDLYQLQLSAELVTLSGCGTGLSVTVGGDEQLGLVRGLLYAGASAVLLTLWDAHDRSTSDFMQVFYARVNQDWSKARAAQAGMWALREKYPHPFYWAPFTIVGNAQGSA